MTSTDLVSHHFDNVRFEADPGGALRREGLARIGYDSQDLYRQIGAHQT